MNADDCWIWAPVPKGKRTYPSVIVNGEKRRASQVAWELHHGRPFPGGMLACHTCDNPHCINPEHIWPGTMSDNLKDAVAKGRQKPNAELQMRRYCKQGHELIPGNTIIRPSNPRNRTCRICRDARNRAREWDGHNYAGPGAREALAGGK